MALIPTWGQSGKGRQIKALPGVHTEMAEMKDKNRLRSDGEQGKRRNLNAEESRAEYRVSKAGVMECEESKLKSQGLWASQQVCRKARWKGRM